LIEDIIQLNRGGSPMSNPIAQRVVEEFRKPHASELALLSPREHESLKSWRRAIFIKRLPKL
jgi:hypothetical protein